MARNENNIKPQPLSALSPKERTLIDQIIDEVFDAGLEEALPLIEKNLSDLGSQPAAFRKNLRVVLQSLWNYFEGLQLIRTQGDFKEAHDLLLSARDGFQQIGHDELRDLSKSFCDYAAAGIELQSMNVSGALELLRNVKGYLRSAGKYGSKFESIIDHMEPEALFVASQGALMALDFTTAKTLTEKASQAAENVAHNYYRDGEPLYHMYRGMAGFVKAIYTFARSKEEFYRFEYDQLMSKQDLVHDAKQALEDLEKTDLQIVSNRNMREISDALSNLLEVISELAQIMQRVFRSTFKPDMQALQHLRQKIGRANDSASRAGPMAVTFCRSCEQFSELVDNLERLAKPSKKDFGKFSGLVAFALFLPLFIVVSWANYAFGIGLEASTLMTSCLILALIGGFGFGALKFKSLIVPSK